MLNLWLLSPLGRLLCNRLPGNGRYLVFARSNYRDTVLAHQTAHATVPDVQADLLQLLCHSWTSVAAQTETRLFLDMRQRDKIGSLVAAGRTVTERTQTARTHIHHATHASDRKCKSVFFDKLKPHGFWLAKNTVAIFKISRSSLRIRFSRRRRSFS